MEEKLLEYIEASERDEWIKTMENLDIPKKHSESMDITERFKQ